MLKTHWHEEPVEKDKRIKGLILSAGGNTVLGKDAARCSKFSFARQMNWKSFEMVAISQELGAVAALRRERKMLASNDARR